jgi:myo-inositol 2-dehydrogenase/D-chiro-inositol 1-dehydrogenase
MSGVSHRTMPLRFGVFGCGRIASSIHLPILAGMRDVAVATIADPDDARRHDALRLVPGAASHADFRESLATGQLDAVVITLPNALHAQAATAVFEHGLHVYVEKPLALSVADGRGLVASWRTAKTVGMVGYNYRFLPSYQEARALITANRIGRLIAVRSVFSSSQRALPEWKRGRDTGGGALLDLASHHVDMAAWLIGAQPHSVFCNLRSQNTQDDVALLQLEFPGGVSAQVCAIFGGPEEHRFEILGERGAIVVNPYGSELVETRPESLDGVRLRHFAGAARALASPDYWLAKMRKSSWHLSYQRALGAFVQGIRAGQSPQPDIAAGCETLVWLDAALESARHTRQVQLASVQP